MSTLTEIVEVAEDEDRIADAAAISAKETRDRRAAPADHHTLNRSWSAGSSLLNVEVAVAVGKGATSLQALQWVLDNHVVPPGGLLHLLHIQAPLRYIPSPMGNNIPVESVSEDVANRHKMQRFLATEQLLYQYKKMCDDRQVNSEVCYAEGDAIHQELVGQISKLCIAKLIIGTSSQSRITKALKKQTIASLVARNAPEFCTVVVICKGKLQSVRAPAEATQAQ